MLLIALIVFKAVCLFFCWKSVLVARKQRNDNCAKDLKQAQSRMK